MKEIGVSMEKYELNKFGRALIIEGLEGELSAAMQRTEDNKKKRKKGVNMTMFFSWPMLQDMIVRSHSS